MYENNVSQVYKGSYSEQTGSAYQVLAGQDSYLVANLADSEEVEVQISDEGPMCECFLAQIAPDGDCPHIQAIKTTTDRESQSPQSQGDIDMYLSRISQLDAELASDQKSAQAQQARIDLWLEQATSKIERKKRFYCEQLDNWLQQENLSTKQLVHGTIKRRGQPVEVEIVNRDLVLTDERFRRIVPEKIEVDRRSLRQYVTRTGEEVPGTCVTVRPHKFSYKLNPASKP